MRDDRGAAKRAVQSQFGRQASWYTVSRRHEQSPGLGILIRLAAPAAADRVLDVATGTGFTAFAMAARCRSVVALDFTAGMVHEAQGLRRDRSATNVTFCLGDAEALPFRAAVFDLVVCRYAAHHFPNLPHAIAEMARVACPGGRIVIDDTCAPEDPTLDDLMNRWEVRRDRSHVRNIPPSRLRALFESAGLVVRGVETTAIPQHFAEWARRGGMSEAETAALRAEFVNAGPAARAAFQIKSEGDDLAFAWGEAVVLGVKR
ncbi:MAG TPA: methyltransferase domain-containing protein [bacterium]|nr:methyltransferase domain-containing protein [bacterium]